VSPGIDTAERMLQCLRRLPNGPLLSTTIATIANAYRSSREPWLVGYSGGKDSTALVKLLFQSLLRVDNRNRPVTILYCDTGVEIPLASALANSALSGLAEEARLFDLPLRTRVLSPPVQERFFAKVLGRGYPPPTDKFRWCTDRLRIDPVSRFLESESFKSATVLLGVREAESSTRRLTLSENQTGDRLWRRQRGASNRRLFMPLLDFTTQDVWLTNLLVKRPDSLRAKDVAVLYANASGECPTIRDVKGAPCGKARFGCWTCTVAKHGVTMRNLIDSGEHRLRPLLDYRLWLERERSVETNRWPRRRNGRVGLGPMTVEWRRAALEKLLEAQDRSGFSLIGAEEIDAIHDYWRLE